MAVTFINQAAFGTAQDSTARVCANFTAEGTNRLLLAYIVSSVNAVASAVYFDNAIFTIAGSVTQGSADLEVWRLIAPTAGVAALRVDRKQSAGAGTNTFINNAIIGYGSADQTTPIAEINAAGALGTVSMSALASVSSDWIAAAGLVVLNALPQSAQNAIIRSNVVNEASGSRLWVADSSTTSGIVTVRWVENSAPWNMLVPVIRHFVAAGGVTIAPTAVGMIVASQAPNIAAGKTISPAAIDIVVAPQAPAIAAGKAVAPGVAEIIAAPQTPAVGAGKSVAPGSTDIIVASQAPGVAAGKSVAPGVLEMVVATPSAEVFADRIVSPGAIDILLEFPTPTIALVTGAAVSGQRFSVYRGRGLRHSEGVRDFEKTLGDEFVSDESE